MGGKTSTASRSKYNAKTYERLVLNLRIDSPQSKKAIEAAAEQAGESATAYVVEAVRRRMEQEQMLSASDTPGVVKNLEGDTDPAEWESCSISPDLIKIQQQKASVFHRNVIGRGFFSVKNSLTHAKEHKSGWHWIWNSKIHLERRARVVGKSEQIIRYIIGSPAPVHRTTHRKRTDQAWYQGHHRAF